MNPARKPRRLPQALSDLHKGLVHRAGLVFELAAWQSRERWEHHMYALYVTLAAIPLSLFAAWIYAGLPTSLPRRARADTPGSTALRDGPILAFRDPESLRGPSDPSEIAIAASRLSRETPEQNAAASSNVTRALP